MAGRYIYRGNHRHLQNSERGHGSYRKAGNSSRFLWKVYEAKHSCRRFRSALCGLKGNIDGIIGGQTFINKLVWENG
jgi:hypothetical protein